MLSTRSIWGVATAILYAAILTSPCYPQAQTAPQDSDTVDLGIIVVSSLDQAEHEINQLQLGADFRALAKKDSIDVTADNGGYMGKMAISTLRPEMREALAGMKPGDVSKPFKSPLGYAILKIFKEVPSAGQASAAGGNAGTDSTGSVKYVFTVGGINEYELGLRQASQLPGWDPTPEAVCRAKDDPRNKQRLEQALSPENLPALEAKSPLDVLYAYYSLGEMNGLEGNMGEAIKQYENAREATASTIPSAAIKLEEALGTSYLHKSEMENDIYHRPGDRCLLPMLPSSKYAKTEDSENAVQHFLKYLSANPNDLEVKWLLNYAYMTLGEYPDKVPPQYLIPASAFKPEEEMPRFHDVAPQAGLDAFSLSGGLIVDDFENNGRLDVVKSSIDSCVPLQYFHNNGDGTFSEQAAQRGLATVTGGLNIVQTDYNNDGCLDILVLRGGWELPQYRSLLRNNCDGTFTDVTAASGLANTPSSSQTAVWVDINNDGLLDLFVGNENGLAQLFLNRGDGTFQDISHSAGIDRIAYTKGVAAADYDNDGYVDLFVSNLGGPDFLYHNNHDNTFTEVAEHAGVQGPTRGFAAWFFDYDNDGWPDLFVTSYFTSVDETARTYLGLPHNATTLKLYKNMHNGTFRDVSAETKLDKVFMPMGSSFGDIDNDGYLDIYLGTGNPSYASLVPNVLLHNKEGKYFTDVTNSTGTGDWHKGHGVAFADLTNRGFEDIIEQMGGAIPGDAHVMRVYENPGNDNDWINLKLVGVKTNRPAIGARIKVTVENKGQGVRSIYRTVGSGGSFGASPFQQHIGLGKDARIKDVEIWWPTSNTRQHFANVQKDQFLEIKEFSQKYVKLERKPYKLGAQNRDSATAAKQVPPSSNH